MIYQGMATSFWTELFSKEHDILSGDVIKIALYTSAADIGPSTTAYTATGEVSGTGYVAGGKILTGATLTMSGDTATLTFSPAEWTAASFTARGAMIYNSSNANKAIQVLDFGTDKTAVVSRPFIVRF